MTNAPQYRLSQRDRPVNQVMERNAVTARSEGAGVTPEGVNTGAAAIGEAMSRLGQGIADVGSALGVRNAFRDDADKRVAMENTRSRQRDVFFRYGQSTGANAAAEREAIIQEMEAIRQDEASKLKGRAREDYLAESYDLQMSRLDKVEEHAVQQERAYVTASRQATIDGHVGDALDGFEDEATFETNLAAAVAETVGLAALEGAQGPVAQQAAEELVAKTVVGRAVLMAERDPEAAINYLNADPRVPEARKMEIREQLAPMARAQRVDGWMSKFATTGLEGSGWAGMLAGAESAGGRQRTNRSGPGGTPASSAEGLFHYTDGTWIGNLRRMRDSGALPAAYAGMTDAQLTTLKNDDVLAEALVDFDAAIYDRIAIGVGMTPTAQTRYVLHHFGEGAGPKILAGMATNPSAPGRTAYSSDAQWRGVVAANPNVLHYGSSIGDLYAWAGVHIGKGAALAGRDGIVGFDFAAAYAFAQTIPDLQDRAAFLQTVQAREGTAAAARTAQAGATLDRVTTNFIATGNSDLTIGDKLALGPEGMTSFQTFVTRTETGSFVDDVDTFGTLSRMVQSGDPREQAAFAAPGYLEQHRHQLTDATYKSFVSARSGIEAAVEGRQFTAEQIKANPALVSQPTAAHRTQMEQSLTAIGRWTKNDRTNELAMQAMQRRLQASMEEIAIREGRPANDQEVRDIILAQSIPIERSGFGGVNKFMFEFDSLDDGVKLDAAVNYEEIPLTDRQMMAARLEALGIDNPTPEQIVTAYETSVMTRGQLVPSGFSEDLTGGPPLEAISHYMLTGKGEELMMADWEEYLRGVLSGSIDPDETPFI